MSEPAPPDVAPEPWGIEPPVPVEGRQWYPAIEAMRGIAALAVVADHCWALAGGSPSFGFGIVKGLGTWGVNVFFLLSGYLLADFFWVNRGRKTTLEFYLRRYFRIAPAYYVCVGLLFLFFAQHDQVFSVQGLKQILANATFTQHFFPATASNLNVDGSLWTLSIEMALYLVMPFFAWAIAKRPVLASVALAAVGVGWRLVVVFHGVRIHNFYFGPATPGQGSLVGIQYLWLERQFIGLIPIFILGMALRWAVLKGAFDLWVARPERHPSLLVLLATLAPSIVLLRATDWGSTLSNRLPFVFFDYLICILAVPAVLYASRPAPVALKAPMLAGVWMGERSYGLYLWHFPVILSVYGMGPLLHAANLHHLPVKVVLIFAISILLGWGSFSLVERPGRLWGRTLGRRATTWLHRGTPGP
jgi:peptidoglycan/LPS O-acetylase OafA/YrhL